MTRDKNDKQDRRRVERGGAARRDANIALLNAAYRAGLTNGKDPMSILRESEHKLKEVRTPYLLRAIFAMRFGKWFATSRWQFLNFLKWLLPWRIVAYRRAMRRLGAELAKEPDGKVVADQLGLRRWTPRRIKD